jgi:putative pyruvate formate lyase activating enzyme
MLEENTFKPESVQQDILPEGTFNLENMQSLYENCQLCPRACGVDRTQQAGVCGARSVLKVGRAALHWWEEPCLVGNRGSGAVFFSHCSLGCVYCQNKQLAAGSGLEISAEKLAYVLLDLQNNKHAANINLVTATHYAPTVAAVLKHLRVPGAKKNNPNTQTLNIPVVWNTSGYENQRTLNMLDGLVDIYLADFKYAEPLLAKRLSNAPDYPEVALSAIETMLRQVGSPVFNAEGLLEKGVIIRHLVLPGYRSASFEVLKLIHEHFGNQVLVSIMNQFTVVDQNFDYEKYGLERSVSEEDYEQVLDFADSLGMEDYFWQEGGASSESFIPAFDGTGIV